VSEFRNVEENSVAGQSVDSPTITFSPVADPFFRLQRALRLAPRQGLGAVRRALFFGLLAWVPIAVWAYLRGRLLPGVTPEPLLSHFAINVRCLLAIPCLVLSDAVATTVLGPMIFRFVGAGLLPPNPTEKLSEVVRGMERLRDRKLVWLLLAGVVALVTLGGDVRAHEADVLNWAVGDGGVGFGGWWFLFVVRPIFLGLLLVWSWRLFLTLVFLRRIAALGLRLKPLHPDEVGGLGFLEQVPAAFAFVNLALSSVIAGHIAHEILYHGAHVASLKAFFVVTIVLLALLSLSPLLPFLGPLRRAKARARIEYGELAGRHASEVHMRWIEGKPVEDEAILTSPELGSSADVEALYACAAGMRALPLGKSSLLAALLPAALPMLVAASVEVPIKQILLKIVGAVA
jgi:hypothetical protein